MVDSGDLRLGVDQVREQNGEPDQARALQTLQAIWKNVFVTPSSAREARTTFELGNGDALILTSSMVCDERQWQTDGDYCS